MKKTNNASLISAAAALRSAGKPVTRDNLSALLETSGVQADPGEVDALLSLIAGEPAKGSQKRPVSRASAPPESGETPGPDWRALYVYAVAAGDPVPFETAGIDGAEVFSIPENGLVAVVHECAAKPYASKDKETVEKWVLRHQEVVAEACRRYAAVLPMAFDMMICGKDRAVATDRVHGWLRDEADVLLRKADRVRRRQEYGVQVFLDVESATREVMDTCPPVVEFQKGLSGKSEGTVYLYKQQLEKLVREEIRKRAETVFREAFELARQHAAEVSVDRVKKPEGNLRMVVNLSCLLENGRTEAMKAAFNEYVSGKGLSVRVTGPWPPYSFT